MQKIKLITRFSDVDGGSICDTYSLALINENIDIQEVLKKVADDFIKIPEGKNFIEFGDGYITLCDLLEEVPISLWNKHGIVSLEKINNEEDFVIDITSRVILNNNIK